MHIGLDYHRRKFTTGVIKANAIVFDLERTANLAIDVQESHHLLLASSADENVSAGGKRCGSPRSCFVAVEQGAVAVTGERFYALDTNDPVGVYRNDGAHLLQDGNEVHDFWLNGSAGQFG